MKSPALWFFDHGIKTFPVKTRDKVPACLSWDDYSAGKMEVMNYTNYGVVLGAFGVVDSDSVEVERWVAANVPATPFMVDTARGVHRYYRLLSATSHFIHRDELTIEFRNTGQYVVGPGSVHASGAIYRARDWSWQVNDVPFFPVNDFDFEDRVDGMRGSTEGEPLVMPERIIAGERHDLLFKLMRKLQSHGIEDVDALLRILKAENIAKCSPPVDEDELVRYIARASKHNDRPGFTRFPVADALSLASILIDCGVSIEASLTAARVMNPKFDPSGAASIHTVPIDEQPSVLELHPTPAVEKIVENIIKMVDESTLELIRGEDLTKP